MSLVATLEHPLPATLPAGTETAVFVYGACGEPVEISVNGARHAAAWVRGRFWATVPVSVHAEAVEIAAATDGGVAPLARSRPGRRWSRQASTARPPRG